ncbi:Golgin subfamily A member 7/ERF4 family-domain-containing protein, partial [Crucibulum laeve]
SHTRPLIPKSSYYFGPPPSDSAYGTPPMGQIGVHHPREILRVERDYTGGELIQFAPIYPLELEGRITPTQFLESVNAINEQLIAAHSLHHAFVDNMITVFSLQLSKLFRKTHYEREMQRLQDLIDDLNAGLYNPVGLNIRWPRDVAFLYLEIEYYVSVHIIFCVLE